MNDLQQGSYLGPRFAAAEIREALASTRASFEELPDEQLAGRIATLLKEQKVIGLFQGRAEFGPRALGSRSIIADARSLEMQSVLNLKIKFRESFRPFAPSVLEDRAAEYFECSGRSPYMLLVAPVLKRRRCERISGDNLGLRERLMEKRSDIPAVTHLDYSARLQTVGRQRNPLFYQIIEEFEKQTGCPVIINTSFNIRGEPIVGSPLDAYRCFMCTNMDYLLIGNFLFDKLRQPDRDKFRKEDIVQELD